MQFDSSVGELLAIKAKLDPTALILLGILCLGVLALAIGIHVLWNVRRPRFGWRDVLAVLLGFFCVLPALAVLGWLSLSVTPVQRPMKVDGQEAEATPIRLVSGSASSETEKASSSRRAEQATGDSDPSQAQASSTIEPKRPEEEPAVEKTEDADDSSDSNEKSPKVAVDRPEWVDEENLKNGDTSVVVLSSSRYATVEEAKHEVLSEARHRLKHYFHQAYPPREHWELPLAVVEERALLRRYVEELPHDFGSVQADMYRFHAQLELSPEVRNNIYPVWRNQVVETRLWILGGIVALLTLMLGTATAYLRIDALTGGRYRGRLKLAAGLLLTAGSLLLLIA